MTKEERIAKVQEMISAPSCCAELKEAADAYLAAVGTEKEADAEKALAAELKEDVTPIDGLIAFAGSPTGEQIFGKEQAQAMLKAAQDAKAGGEDTCICAACQAGKALLKEFGA
ncbi:MAG: hypothetical protein K6E83_01985 [Clostridium sp.]|nr:hypothetical protein [Clostridium sp.]